MEATARVHVKLARYNPTAADSDDEESLLAQQREFLAKREQAAATVMRHTETKNKSPANPPPLAKPVQNISSSLTARPVQSAADETFPSPAVNEHLPNPISSPFMPTDMGDLALSSQDFFDMDLHPIRETQSDLPSGTAATVRRTAPPPVIAKASTIRGTPIARPSKPAISAQAASNANLATYSNNTPRSPPAAAPPAPTKKKRSLFAERRAQVAAAQNQHSSSVEGGEDSTPSPRYPPRHIESADALFGNVLANVVEKDPSVPDTPIKRHIPAGGFPEILHRTDRVKPQEDLPPRKSGVSVNDVRSVFKDAPADEDPAIHQDNVRKIEGMSAEEMEEAQAEILSRLDPAIVDMLIKRAAEKYGGGEKKDSRVKEPFSKTATVVDEKPAINPTKVRFTEAPPILPQRKPLPAQAWIPNDKLEPDKLEWMDESDWSSSSQTTASKSTLRFDFKGSILEPNQDIPTHLGLHHHGDDPDLAGYTLDELLHLSRSTVPNQRVISLRTLAIVVERAYKLGYGVERSREIFDQLRQKNLLLNVRVAMDQSHGTVVTSALEVLVAYLCGGVECEEELLWDRITLGRLGYRSFAISVESVGWFGARALGTKYEKPEIENNGTLGSAIGLMKYDGIDGLVSTNVLTRCRYLLEWEELSLDAHQNVLAFLIRVCRHSRASAASVAECEGLVDAVRARFIRTSWPPVAASRNDSKIASSDAVKLMRLLSQSGLDVAESLLKYAVVEDVMRFVAVERRFVGEAYRSLADDLMGEVWGLLGVLFSYGLCGRVFDEYRQLLMASARALFGEGQGGGEEEISLRNRVLFLRMMRGVVRSFGHLLDLGGIDDAVEPIFDVVWSYWERADSTKDEPTLAAYRNAETSAIIDLLAAYFGQFQQRNDATFSRPNALVDKLLHSYSSIWSQCAEDARAVIARTTAIGYDKSTTNPHTCLLHKKKFVLASILVDLSAVCDKWSSLIDFLFMVAALDTNQSERIIAALTADSFIHPLEAFVNAASGLVSPDDHVRVFLQGKPRLLYAWAFGVHSRLSGSTPTLSLAAKLVSTSVVAIADSVPGDEYLVAKLLNAIVLHDRYQSVLAVVLSQSEEDL
ncbi:RNA polymerase II associated protein 1, partial [Rhizophlyctis rosea]